MDRHIPPWLQWARRIQALAQSGLTYTRDEYDRERYTELIDIAATMLTTGSGESIDLATARMWFAAQHGYATPKVGIRAVVFDDNARLLLVRERADGGWAPPGGWADIGDTPAQVAVREVREESGYEVRVKRVIAVLDRDKQGHAPIPWHIYIIYFLCELVGGTAMTSHETPEVGWFARDAMPVLSDDRIQPHLIELFYAYHADDTLPVAFD